MEFVRYMVMYQDVSESGSVSFGTGAKWNIYPTPFLTLAAAREVAYMLMGSKPPSAGGLGPEHIKIVQEIPKGF